MDLTFIDFCSGIGGGRLGLELNGFKCLGFSEIDIQAIKTYRTFFNTNDELELGDITEIDAQNLPNFDLLISGFPCQSFSIVGKRKGLQDDKNGQIIHHLVKILKFKQPHFFILENVKGLVNHNRGNTLKTIIKLLESCHYNLSYQVLNTIDFNLSHSRERIYFIGIHKDRNLKFSFETLSLYENQQIKNFLQPNAQNKFNKDSQSYQTFLKYLNNKYNQNRFNLDEILKQDFLILDTRQSDMRLYKNKIPTLRRNRQGLLYVFNKNLYKISAIEALKLQGFDKIPRLEKKLSSLKENDVLKQCGNAISVNVIEKIAKNIKDIFYG